MTALVTLEVVGPVLLVVLRVPPVWALGVNSHKLHGSPLCLPTSTAASLVTNGSVCVCVCVCTSVNACLSIRLDHWAVDPFPGPALCESAETHGPQNEENLTAG